MSHSQEQAILPERRRWPLPRRSDLTFLGGVAVLVGLVTGLGADLLRRAIQNGLVGLEGRGWVQLAGRPLWPLPAQGDGATWWGLLLAVGLPMLGLLLATALVRLLAEGEQGRGIAGIMEAVALRGGRIRLRPALARILASAVTIVSGGSVGAVDPSVHIGATLASWLGRRLRLPDRRVQVLVACGAAGGIASAFDAPIAGVFFAQEIILGEFAATAFGMVVLSSVTAAVIGKVLRGDAPAFLVPAYTLRSPWEMFLYLGLGLLAALVSVGYVRILLGIESLLGRWRSPWLRVVAGGLFVGALGLAFPHLLGSGYETMEALLQGRMPVWWVLLALVLLKPLATATTLSSGGSGGLFAPALFIGSALGGVLGQLLNRLFPQITAPAPAYALVGMGAVLAGAAHCPITAILLLFEMTRDYHIILPVMLSAVVSTLLAQWLSPDSIYTEQMTRRGIRLRLGRDMDVMERITVREAMRQEFAVVRPEMSLETLGRVLEESDDPGLPVVDAAGRLCGIVTLSDYRRALAEGTARTVAEVCTPRPVVVFPDQTLVQAMQLLADCDVGRLLVVDPDEPRRVVGLLRQDDLIRAYRKGLTRRQEIARQVQQMQAASYREGELLTVELDAQAAAAGHLVRDLALPEGTIIVSVQRGDRTLLPRGSTRLEAGDLLVVMVEDAAKGQSARALLLEGKGLPHGRQTRYTRYDLPATAPAVGRRIVDLNLSRDSLLVSVHRAGRTMVAYPDLLLEPGDQVTLFAEAEEIPWIEHALLGRPLPAESEALPRNLLVLLDGGEADQRALEQALTLAAPVEGTVHALLPADLDGLALEEVRAGFLHCCRGQGVEGLCSVRPGPWDEAVDRLEVGEDMVIVGRPDAPDAVWTEQLTRLLERVDRPLLLAGRPRPPRRLCLLAAPGDEGAVRWADQLARAWQAALVVVLPAEQAPASVQRTLRSMSTEAEVAFLEPREETWAGLARLCREKKADLLLLGERPTSAETDWWQLPLSMLLPPRS